MKISIISSLTYSCQGLNDNKIDPVLLAHTKAVADFYWGDCVPYLEVFQTDFKDSWLYSISAIGLLDPKPLELPTDIIKYKDAYILFYLRGKKQINRKLYDRTLDSESPDCENGARIWTYLKDKHSDKSIFVQSRLGILVDEIPEIRYFSCGGEDSAAYYANTIDMAYYKIKLFGKEKDGKKFSNLHKIAFGVAISNQSDSTLHLSTTPDGYGYFVIKNGNSPIPFHVSESIDAHEVSPGMYEIGPRTKAVFYLETEEKPIVFEKTSADDYPDKIYELIHDSIFYMPTHVPLKSDRRNIWNKKFKVYMSYTWSYFYEIGGKEYRVYYDGEIKE